MDHTRYLNLLKLYKKNVPWYAQNRLNKYLTLRAELATQYAIAKKKENAEAIQRITDEGLEIKQYIQALT